MNTRARVGTVCQNLRFFSSVEQNLDHVLGLLDLVMSVRPDIVCLPENFATVGMERLDVRALAETLPGPTTDRVAKYARRGHCYVICPMLTLRENRVFNSAVIVDRRGEIAGVYDKICPVTTSPDYTLLESGVAPGAGDGVFDLDFGRIGLRICFDVGFPETWQAMKQQDVRLVFWASAYDGGFPLTTHAAMFQYYVVSSVRTDRSRIIDPCGTMLAATNGYSNVAWRDINLDFVVCHTDFNYGISDEILADYGDRVEVRAHADAGRFLVEPIDPSVTTQSLQERYGFESADQYHARHRDAYGQCRQGGVAAPQVAAHRSRVQYAKPPRKPVQQ